MTTIANVTRIEYRAINVAENTAITLYSEDELSMTPVELHARGLAVYNKDSIRFETYTKEYYFDRTARFSTPKVINGETVKGDWRGVAGSEVVTSATTKIVKVSKGNVSWK